MTITTDCDDLPPYIVPFCAEEPAILYEDADLLLVNKPHLLLSVPGRHRLNKDCLITRLRLVYPSASIVHRLDLDTSGIMIIPLSKPAHSHISRQFQERRIYKTYQAVVFGMPMQDAGEITLPIAPDWNNRPLQLISAERGKQALTRYEVISRDPAKNRSRLLLKPLTGRTHQLRIHLAETGHPILGCDMYAHEEALRMSERLMLHAHTLQFKHPITGAPVIAESELPF